MPGNRAFRFLPDEVDFLLGELERLGKTPPQHVLEEYTVRLNSHPQRKDDPIVSKQLWNWFQNRRHHFRKQAGTASAYKAGPAREESPEVGRRTPEHEGLIQIHGPTRGRGRPPKDSYGPLVRTSDSFTQGSSRSQSSSAGPVYTEEELKVNLDYESLSTRDDAWYDVEKFVGKQVNDQGQLEMKVHFAGFSAEENEWVNVKMGLRQRSMPCEASECVGVLPGDLVLCFQEGHEQALYFDADVYEVQRRRHDVRGCRCRFKVRYRVDGSEEVVPLRKICRRPETEYRFQLAAAASAQVAAALPALGGTAPQ